MQRAGPTVCAKQRNPTHCLDALLPGWSSNNQLRLVSSHQHGPAQLFCHNNSSCPSHTSKHDWPAAHQWSCILVELNQARLSNNHKHCRILKYPLALGHHYEEACCQKFTLWESHWVWWIPIKPMDPSVGEIHFTFSKTAATWMSLPVTRPTAPDQTISPFTFLSNFVQLTSVFPPPPFLHVLKVKVC